MAFISRGYKTWKKVPESFAQHERSRCHQTAVKRLKEIGQANATRMQILSGKAKQMQQARVALDCIFDAIEFLAHQGLPLRGHDSRNGNLHELLKTWAKKSPELEAWLKRDTQQLLSPTVQNEILELMAHTILRDMAAEVKASEAFAVIVDESPDASHTEQVSMCVRFVDSDFVPQELFVGFYATEVTNAATLAKLIMDTLKRLDLPTEMLYGQCYDGASNMSGRFNGVQALIKEVQPHAVFVHCAAHRMNLATLGATTASLRNSHNEASAIIEFIRASPKRLAVFEHQKADDAPRLCSYSRTRWTTNERCLRSLLDNWVAVMDTLAAIESDDKAPQETTVKARGFRRAMESFDFFFMISLGLLVFQVNILH